MLFSEWLIKKWNDPWNEIILFAPSEVTITSKATIYTTQWNVNEKQTEGLKIVECTYS